MKAHITKEPADICEYYTQDCNISFLATVKMLFDKGEQAK